MSIIRKENKKIQFHNLRCSDGLPCTAYTCIQDWCKFPERKIEAQKERSNSIDGKKT
jgi:hypothetical protein